MNIKSPGYSFDGRGMGCDDSPTHMRRMYWNVVSVIACLFVTSAIGLSGIPDVARSAAVLAATLVVLLGIGRGMGWVACPGFVWLPIPFVVFSMLSLLWSPPKEAMELMPMFTTWVGSFAVAVALSNKRSWRIIEYGLILAVGANLVAWCLGVDIYQELNPHGSSYFVYGGQRAVRSTGLIGNANEYSVAMIGPALLAWTLPEAFGRINRWLLLGAAVFAAQISASKLGLLMLGGLLLVVIVVPLLRTRHANVTLLILGIVVTCWIFLKDELGMLTEDFSPLYRLSLALEARDNSVDTRMDLIRIGWSLFLDSPAIGYGFASFANVSNADMYAHNNWIELAVNGGIVGLVLFYGMHISIVRAARRIEGKASLAIPVLILVLVGADCAMVSYASRMVALILATSCVVVFPVLPRRGWRSPLVSPPGATAAVCHTSSRARWVNPPDDPPRWGDIPSIGRQPPDRADPSPSVSQPVVRNGEIQRPPRRSNDARVMDGKLREVR